MVICLERGADLHMAQLMPLPLTVSCFSKIQIGFTFLVPAHPGSPGKRAAKRVCVCVCTTAVMTMTTTHRQSLASRGGAESVLGRHMASVEPKTPKAWSSRRRRLRRRMRRGGEEWGQGIPLPSRLWGLGSVVSFPSGVLGRALTKTI